MKETRADTRTALLQALGLHVVLFALMFAGLQWSWRNAAQPSAGDPIEADLVDPSALSAAMRRALARDPEPLPAPVPEPEPLPEPVPEALPAPPPEPVAALPAPVPDPQPVEQEKVQRDAPSQEVARVPREQERKQREPPQVDLEAKRRAEQERQKQQQLADLRRQLEKARRERTMAEQRAEQLKDARDVAPAAGNRPASPPPGNRGTDDSLLAHYRDALQQAITRQWVRPESVQLGQRCKLSIRQLPGGEVVDVTISPGCPFDEPGRQSVERAVLKASPLPYAGFESVFNRTLNLDFIAEDR